MRIAVIGAGLSGLAAAGSLHRSGHRVIVFEKSLGLGGRLATRRTNAGAVDHGCPFLDSPAGTCLRQALDRAHCRAGSILTAPDREVRDRAFGLAAPIGCAAGVTAAAQRFADDLDIVLGTRITVLRPDGDGFEIGDEHGNGHGRVDAVIVSAPAPQAADLLETGSPNPERVAALRAIAYHPALVVILVVPGPPPAAPIVIHPESGPALRLVAAPRRVPGEHAIVVTLDPGTSAELIAHATDAQIVAIATAAPVAHLWILPNMAWAQVKRWRYAVTPGHGGRPVLNPLGTRLVLCGDAIAPTGLANAFASGLVAADRVAALV